MALSVPERIAQVAEHFARHDAHGYSQPNRGTGGTETVTLSDGSKVTVSNSDVDCSEMVRQCVDCALSGNYRSPIEYLWTGNEDAELTTQGFTRMAFSASKVKRGDVLWVSGHTGVALGNGLQADAHGDEYGGITGPRKGDQTGHEVEVRSLRSWTYIYRYAGGEEGGWFSVTETHTFKKKSRVHVEPMVKSKYTYTYQPGEQVAIDGLLIAEGYVWGTYVGASTGARRYVILGSAGRVAK